MRVSYILAGAFLAMLVVPGTASQLAARSAMTAPLMATPVSAAAGGAFHDPNAAPKLSIVLPVKFTALDIGTHPLQSFNG
jgi:hypothetical protein